jgi:parallel beta-helix repeat protein
VLAADIGPCPGNGINIAVSNVNLTLNGYTITGPSNGSGTGINICALSGGSCSSSRISNINVQGAVLIQQFANGIYLQNVDNSQIQNVVAAYNNFGLLSSNCTNLQYKANVATRNGLEGFLLFDDSNDQVQQNTASGNDTSLNVRSGIALVGGGGHQVQNNDSDASSCHGIYIDSANNKIHNNTAFGNGNTNPACAGIYVETGASGNDIHNNTSQGNQTYDLEDANNSCDSNKWHNDTFFTNNLACVQ